MNNLKKTLLLGFLLAPGIMQADAQDVINVTAEILRQGPGLMNLIEGIPGVGGSDGFNKVNQFLIKPAYSLGGLLKDLPVIQEQLTKTLADMKSMPTIARCSSKTSTALQTAGLIKTTCEPLGCTSRYACMRVGVNNLKNLLLTLNNIFLTSQSTLLRDGQGVVPIILDIAQQTNVKTTIKNDVSDNLLKVANLLDELLKIIPAS